MRAVIAGNGLAGTIAAKTLRELDGAVEIEVFAEETHPYYPRPNLIEFLAGRMPYDRLFAFPEGWAERQRIAVRSGVAVTALHLREKTVETSAGATVPYDRLLLACGSLPAIPAIEGTGRRGVFVLRTIEDAQALLDHARAHPRIAVLGGGLLGLEIARALRRNGFEVSVVEVFAYLLPRQLDARAAGMLRDQIEKTGVRVRVGCETREITGDAEARGLAFRDGTGLDAETVVLAAGIRPRTELAAAAGLAVETGVVVNDVLQTGDPHVFAAGDIAQHRGRVYGIIPAAFEQARTAAVNMLRPEKPYEGTVPSNTLKVMGLNVMSAGLFAPGDGCCEELVDERPEEGIYKKLVFEGDALVGAIWLGTKRGAVDISRLVSTHARVGEGKRALLRDDFDFTGM